MTRSTVATSLLCLSALTGVSEAAFNWANVNSVVAFGDSYSSVWGTAGYPNYTFIGSNLPSQYAFTPSQLLNDRIIQNYSATAEGGPNWLEFLTGCAVKPGLYLPRSCSNQLWDFAFSGASYSKQFFPPHHSYTVPVANQTQRYLSYADQTLALDKSRSLITFWFGINDVFDTKNFYTGPLTDEQLWNQIISASFQQSVMPLLRAGFRNVLMMNFPPLDRAPPNLRSSDPYPTKSMVDLWNSILAKQSAQFQASNPGTKIMVYDDNKFFNQVLNSPGSYGIRVTDNFCRAYENPDVANNPSKYGCYPLSQYFWQSGAHM
ncbi:hypothetical protein PFICI_05364 [Pestalotiopsis fici W106-1]|uniref:SGNH hydrolase-type esterase domain-containing protein n=1 Tax=Pestalotiopsis fici (strain W106-1 / CGMCC3.15140) TaxID=1229662 RepID=W3XBM7_PESFW|nr:uncharacterized protein PFICI_05364 [Pestalotiopsis fici W106-1]ETS83488.1 hypothetical protein PFICI_05364 [Pestalotiopsis fici W106-1]